MTQLYYKIIRRAGAAIDRFSLSHKLSGYRALSAGRYVFGQGFKAGKLFHIQSDLTETEINIGDDFYARDGFHIVMGQGGKLQIGNHCFLNNYCSINCLGAVAIGNNCQFGENVFLYDHNHKYGDADKLISAQGYSTGSIKIGNNCWIGSNVVILKDVVIGDNVVIGAGCVIHRSVEAGVVVINKHQQEFK